MFTSPGIQKDIREKELDFKSHQKCSRPRCHAASFQIGKCCSLNKDPRIINIIALLL